MRSHANMRVIIVDVSSLVTMGVCNTVQWKVQNSSFVTDFLVLPLKGCDLVLGI